MNPTPANEARVAGAGTGNARLRRTSALALGMTGVLASALLTGCTPGGDVIDADYAKVCRDNQTNNRVEDVNCDSSDARSSGHFGWYFLPMGVGGSRTTRSIPGVGTPLSGGVTSIPSTATSKSGTPSKGSSSVSRGGFGGSAKGGSGTGS
jgi:hypothetical protein